ncbi:MAG: hypothetical protein H8E42_00015 [Nitrospinae bacterium]|nr:hypothetical protein [Nitrospinota bacterium]
MANKIQAWAAYGPKIELANPMTKEEIIENIVAATNQSKGSVLAVLSELDVQTEAGLKAGRIVQLPNRTHYEPIGKSDGSVKIGVRVSPELEKKVNTSFRGVWKNRENAGKTEAEMIELWNQDHPEDLIDD